MSDERVPTFRNLSSVHGAMFEVFTVRGLCVQHETKSGSSTFGVTAAFQPTEIITTIDPTGKPKYAIPFPTQAFQLSYGLKTPEVRVSLIGGRTKIANFTFKPIKPLHLQLKFVKVASQPTVPTVSAQIRLQHASTEFVCQTRDYHTISMADLRFSVGTADNALGVQLVHRPGLKLAWSALLHHRWESGAAALSIVRDEMVLFCVRMKKRINEYWQAGLNLQVDEKLISGLTLGWKARIGKCQVHSAVNLLGELKTHFRVSITPRCDLVLTEHLDHPNCAYRTGIALAWFPEPKSK